MPHATSARPYPRTRSRDAHRVGERLVSVEKSGGTLFEELNRADQASGGVVSAAVPGVSAEKSPSQPLETIFLESCDITEVDVSFDEVPVELTLVDVTMEESFEVEAPSLPSRGGPETVTVLPLVTGWSEPTHVPSLASRPENPSPESARRPQPRSCTDCHHANTPLTVRQKRFEYLQTMCGPSPALPELLSAPEPLSQRCDWKIQGGMVGDWRKCPTRPPPVFEQHFRGSEFELLETRRRELTQLLRARAAREKGIPVHLYVPAKPFFEWPAW